MLTPTHGIISWLYAWSGKRERPLWERFLLCLGAVLPDLPLFGVGFWEWSRYMAVHPRAWQWRWVRLSLLNLLYRNEELPIVAAVYTNVGFHTTALFLRQCLHSVFFWLAVLIVCWVAAPRLKKILPVFWGALVFHIVLDVPTHTDVALAYLWPVVQSPIRGFISHDNPWLLRFEIAIWFLWACSAALWLGQRLWEKAADWSYYFSRKRPISGLLVRFSK